jgi:tetratricopeptide (TPR) repeat protein
MPTKSFPPIPVFDFLIRGFLFLLVVSVPLFFSFHFTTYTLPKVVLTQVLVSLILGTWLLKMTISGDFAFSRPLLFFPILSYFIISLFSLIPAISLPGGISLLWQISAYVLVYFIVIHHIEEQEIEEWALIVTLVGIVVSGYGLLQYLGIEPFLKGYDYISHIPFSTLGHRNQVAQYLVLIIPLSGAFFFRSSSWIKRIAFGVGTAVMIYHLYISKSRGGILGFILAGLFLLGVVVFKALKMYPGLRRRKWPLFLIPLFLILMAIILIPSPLTLEVKHINPIGYYVHSIDGSRIPANQFIRLEFDYRVIRGDPQKPGYLNFYSERTNSGPVYLVQDRQGWNHVKTENIYFPSTPYDENIKLRWVPGSEDSVVQFRNIIVETKEGKNLIKDAVLDRIFANLGVTEVDKALSGQARLYMYRNTIRMIGHNLFLGAGFGNFKYVYPRYRDRGEWALSGLNTRVEQAHNEYLQILSEVGIIGFLAFLWILWSIGRMSFFIISKESFSWRFFLHLALVMGILATLIQSFFDFNLQNPASGVTFWMVAGFLEVVYRSVKKGVTSSDRTPVRLSIPATYRFVIGIGISICLITAVYFSVRPAIGDYYLKWGRSLLEQKDWQSALFSFQKAKDFSPANFDIYFHMGQTCDQLKDYDQAVSFYKKSISLHPYFIEARNNLGAVYIKMGMIDEAMEEFKGSIEINPYHPGLHNNLGYLYGKRNLLRRALEEYNKALELDPENAEAHKNLGLLYFYRLKDYSKAQKFWERYVVLNPSDPQNESIRRRIEEIKKGKVQN